MVTGMQNSLSFADLLVVLVPLLCALWLWSLRHVWREMHRPARLRR